MSKLPHVLPAYVLRMNAEESESADVPPILDRMTDHVLAYKPKPKTKAAKKRARRKKRKARE